jgi:hypothetical protein
MAIYTVHRVNPAHEGGKAEAVFVKEAFAWPAFFFTGFWALWNKMWFIGIALIATELALDSGLAALGIDAFVRGAVLLSYLLIVGFFANDWRRHSLKSKGYASIGLVSGESREAAARRYYDHAL